MCVVSSIRTKVGWAHGKSNPRLRLFLWTAIFGLIFGAINFGQPLEDVLRSSRNLVRQHDASGDIVLIKIDDRSLQRIEKWPWPRRYHAQLAENLHEMGARRVFFDIDFSSASNPSDDRVLERALAGVGKKVVLPVQFTIDPVSGERTDHFPLASLRQHVSLATINLRYNGQGAVWRLPYALDKQGRSYRSFAALMADVRGPSGETFPIDYSIDPASIPTVSAVDVIEQRTAASAIAGRDVVIGSTSQQLGDNFYRPGHGLISGVYLHVLGAETLKTGRTIELGWFPAFALALVIAGCALRFADVPLSIAIGVAGLVTFLGLPFLAEAHLIYVDVVPALFVLLVIGGVDAFRKLKQSFRLQGIVNAVSGLPNLNALRRERAEHSKPLIAARIQNYPEIVSALPPEEEKTLVEQIAGRLKLGAPSLKLFHGDEGIFAWFAEYPSPADHLEALHAMFRSPILVGSNLLDLTITFGLDRGSERSLSNRLGSALVAADEAAVGGLRWKEYDPAKLKDAAWKLSLLSQLEAAIDSGDLWVAYQPQLDLTTNRIVGAEALVRWTHPEKGPISPIEFVLAAEQSDRIEKLTGFVLDQSLARVAALNARGIEFGLSVNLSARLVEDPKLVERVRTLLQKYGLPARLLTLEVTETVALTGGDGNFQTLSGLRKLGVQLSIDDYGTGLSTLEYLKKIPATEIKIDQSFIQAMSKSRSDALMVNSTVQLAHSLGQKVVAEGVEEVQTLETLRRIGCDLAQGYYIGRPMTFRAISRQLLEQAKREAA